MWPSPPALQVGVTKIRWEISWPFLRTERNHNRNFSGLVIPQRGRMLLLQFSFDRCPDFSWVADDADAGRFE